MTKTNAEMGEKNQSFWIADVKTSLLRGLMKFKTFFLKVEYEGELRIFESNLFHSTNADEKKKKRELKKKLFLTVISCLE